jgi:hypothetical protein
MRKKKEERKTAPRKHEGRTKKWRKTEGTWIKG